MPTAIKIPANARPGNHRRREGAEGRGGARDGARNGARDGASGGEGANRVDIVDVTSWSDGNSSSFCSSSTYRNTSSVSVYVPRIVGAGLVSGSTSVS